MKVVQLAVGKLKPYAKNPRQNDRAVKAVARSIQEFGFRQPIVADPKHVIIAGHTRWKAAKLLGLKTVPVHIATDLTPKQIRAYRIADNQTASLADWDYDKLIDEIGALEKGGVDLKALGFSGKKLGDLVRAAGDGEGLRPEPELPPMWQVVIECGGEAEQRKLYDRLVKEGLTCRLLTL